MEELKSNKRDILIIVGLFVLLVALVVVADLRAKTYQDVVVAGGSPVALADGQDNGNNTGNGSGQGGNAVGIAHQNNTIEFFKMVLLITFIFILFIALITTMIILVIRVIQNRLSKARPGAGQHSAP
jgi:hypothetical protein